MSRSLVAGAMRLAMWKWSKDRKVSSICTACGQALLFPGVQGHVKAGPWGVIAVTLETTVAVPVQPCMGQDEDYDMY